MPGKAMPLPNSVNPQHRTAPPLITPQLKSVPPSICENVPTHGLVWVRLFRPQQATV
jgi:hypothetical protein